MCLLTMFVNAQNKEPTKEISVNFNVFLDNKKIESDSIYVSLHNHNYTVDKIHYIRITDSFVTFFKVNKIYNFVITHPRYNKVIVKINTFKIDSAKYNIYLSSNKSNEYINYE